MSSTSSLAKLTWRCSCDSHPFGGCSPWHHLHSGHKLSSSVRNVASRFAPLSTTYKLANVGRLAPAKRPLQFFQFDTRSAQKTIVSMWHAAHRNTRLLKKVSLAREDATTNSASLKNTISKRMPRVVSWCAKFFEFQTQPSTTISLSHLQMHYFFLSLSLFTCLYW